jgi:maleylacetoacetate isomerase/maleylpyruvate isomerase
MALTLYSMWRATAPYRVRIGLNLKGLSYDYVGVDLVGGEARRAPYVALNGQGLLPALVTDEGPLTQSLAILEWLEETHPAPPLLPAEPRARARARAMAEIVACDIHPLNNLRVLQALNARGVRFGSEEQTSWIHAWISAGFDALEPMIADGGAGFAAGEAPGLADCCLIPQVFSAERYGLGLAAWPAIRAVAAHAAAHPAFAAAHPDRQPDAPKS